VGAVVPARALLTGELGGATPVVVHAPTHATTSNALSIRTPAVFIRPIRASRIRLGVCVAVSNAIGDSLGKPVWEGRVGVVTGIVARVVASGGMPVRGRHRYLGHSRPRLRSAS
jgi:hypothetical protein